MTGRPLYVKASNEQIAQLLVLDRDLPGTDLATINHLIAEHAKALARLVVGPLDINVVKLWIAGNKTSFATW